MGKYVTSSPTIPVSLLLFLISLFSHLTPHVPVAGHRWNIKAKHHRTVVVESPLLFSTSPNPSFSLLLHRAIPTTINRSKTVPNFILSQHESVSKVSKKHQKTMVTIPETMISSSEGLRPVPVIAMGTATESGIAGIEVVTPSTLTEAIKVGYRHFDTAAIYRTEKPVGEAIAEALRSGLIKSRSEIFITTKLWCNSADRHLVVPAIKQSLKNLGLEYVDLYLIHWPLKLIQDEYNGGPVPNECVAALDMKAAWEGMEECQNLGLTKSIGVSNFSFKRIQQLLSFAKIPPAVNQIEMNPHWQQKKITEFCKANGILVTAYLPLGGDCNTALGHKRVMECDVLRDIAKSKGKTVAQISLRWLYEQGVSIAVKSFNTERMKQNLGIFDWSLTENELNKIDRIPQCRHLYLIGTLVTQHNDVLAEIDAELD